MGVRFTLWAVRSDHLLDVLTEQEVADARENADLRLAVLSEADFTFLRLFLQERLQDPYRTFMEPPHSRSDLDPPAHSWDAWVREVLGEIASTPLAFPAASLVSFLG